MATKHTRILAVDQARSGGWSVYDYDKKKLLDCGDFTVGAKHDFEEFIYMITTILDPIIKKYKVDYVFFEDTQYQTNVNTFKKLCWLQGALICWLREHNVPYGIVHPRTWQSYCNARGRNTKEKKDKITASKSLRETGKRLTIEFVAEQFGIQTDNDNLADAVCIGFYVVNCIEIKKGNEYGEEKGI